MIVKYSELANPIHFKRGGHVLQASRQCNQMNSKPNYKRVRSPNQLKRQAILFYLSQLWHTLSADEKQNWQLWVDFLPQHTIKSLSHFLAPYQNFTRRNFFKILNSGNYSNIMLEPNLVAYEFDPVQITSNFSDDLCYLNFNFSRNDSTLLFYIFCTIDRTNCQIPPGRNELFLMEIPNASTTIQISNIFFSKFGFYPQPHDTILARYFAVGSDNGQFFDTIIVPVLPAVSLIRVNLATDYLASVAFYLINPLTSTDFTQSFSFPSGTIKNLTVKIGIFNPAEFDCIVEIYDFTANVFGSLVATSQNVVRVKITSSDFFTFLFSDSLPAGQYAAKFICSNFNASDYSGQTTAAANPENQYPDGFIIIFVDGTRYDLYAWSVVGYFEYEP